MARTGTSSWALLGARFLLALIFLVGGFEKFANLDHTAQLIAAQGLPAAKLLAVLAASIEIVGGLSVLLGVAAWAGAVLLALYLIPTTLVFHDYWTMSGAERQMQLIQFMKNLAVEGGLIYTAVFGAGALSVDTWLAKHARLPSWWPRSASPAS